MKYEQPYGVADPNAPYINGNPATGTEGSIPSAAVFQNPQTEIVNLIAASGLLPTDSDLYQLLESVRSQFVNYAVDTGSVNHVSAAYTPALLVRKLGQPYRIKILNNNTGASDFNDGLGIAPIKLSGGADLAANELVAGMIAELAWDGTNFQLVNSTVGGGGGGTVNNFTIKIPYIADTGAVNALVAPFSPAITAPIAGDPILVKIANNNSGPTTILVNALAAVAVQNRASGALAIGDLVAGQIALMIFTGSVWQLLTAFGSGSGTPSPGGGMAGYSGLIGSAPGATKTASWTAGELIVENLLGGTAFKGANLSLAFNGAITGAGGMDTGATPNVADLSIYAIYNPTLNAWNTLGCLGSTSRGKIYGGANMPSGYAASVLIWSGKCDINGNILQFIQYDREIDIVPVIIFNGSTPALVAGQYVFAGVSISVAVPANAVFASGTLNGDGGCSVCAVPTAAGNPGGFVVPASGLALQGGFFTSGFSFKALRLSSAQTVYWAGNGTTYEMLITAYQI